jgi:hypothetical protein
MSREDEYRRRAEALLTLAAGADNMKERGRLIDEAMHWHNLALDLHDSEHRQANDNDDADEAEARA